MKTSIFLIVSTLTILFHLNIQAQNCDAGTLSGGAISFICGGEFGLVSASGTLGNSIYILHNGDDASLGTIYSTSNSGLFMNDGTLPTNQELCISSFGIPDPNGVCYDLSECSRIVFLSPITIDIIQDCNVTTGLVEVSYTINGGAPEYLPTVSFYQITGSNGHTNSGSAGENYIIGSFVPDIQINISIDDDGKGCTHGTEIVIDDGSCIQNSSNVWPGDLNNDGIVNNQDVSFDENDRQAVDDNLGQIWSVPNPVDPPDESDYQVILQPTKQVYDGNLVMNVSLERKAEVDLTLQAGHFTIDYSDIEGNFSYVDLAFLPISWLGTPNNNLWYKSTHFPNEKKIEVGFTKTNDIDSKGSGVIGQLILEYDSGSAKHANISYNFEVNSIGVHQNNGNFIPIEDQLLQVNLNSICQPNWAINEDSPFQNKYKSSGDITTGGFVLIGANQEVEYKANRVTLNTDFRVKAGATFKAKYGSCD